MGVFYIAEERRSKVNGGGGANPTFQDELDVRPISAPCFEISGWVFCAGPERVISDAFMLFFETRQRKNWVGFIQQIQIRYFGPTDSLVNVFDISKDNDPSHLAFNALLIFESPLTDRLCRSARLQLDLFFCSIPGCLNAVQSGLLDFAALKLAPNTWVSFDSDCFVCFTDESDCEQHAAFSDLCAVAHMQTCKRSL